jgi:hypothetical protein
MAKKPDEPVKVLVKILPLRGIGGYGDAGDEVMMPESDAAYYVEEGYVRVLDVPKPVVVVESDVSDVTGD